ncbi:MAG: hypothetical protein ACOX17_03265 [Christensenellales bacterium]|jgi:hypothetical protein
MKEKLQKLLLPGLFASTIFAPLMVPVLIAEAEATYSPLIVFSFLLFWGIFGWALAVLFPRVKLGWFLAVSILVPGTVSFFLCWGWFGLWWVGLIAGLMASLIACLSAWRCMPPLGYSLTGTTIGSVLISHSVVYVLLTMLNFFFSRSFHASTEAILPIGIFSFIGCCFLGNWVFTMQLAGSDVRTTRVPVSIRRANLIMTAVFTGITMVIAFIPALRKGFQSLFGAIGRWIGRLKDIRIKLDMVQDISPNSTASMKPLFSEEAVEYTPVGEAVENVLKVLAVIFIAASICVLLFFLGKLVRKLWQLLWSRLQSWMKRWNTPHEDYEDEQEKAVAWERVKQDTKAWMDRMAQRLKPRPRLEDCRDDRERLRLLYRWILEKRQKRGLYNPASTPNELSRELNMGEETFFRGYNESRYSPHIPDPNAVRAGKEALRKS